MNKTQISEMKEVLARIEIFISTLAQYTKKQLGRISKQLTTKGYNPEDAMFSSILFPNENIVKVNYLTGLLTISDKHISSKPFKTILKLVELDFDKEEKTARKLKRLEQARKEAFIGLQLAAYTKPILDTLLNYAYKLPHRDKLSLGEEMKIVMRLKKPTKISKTTVTGREIPKDVLNSVEKLENFIELLDEDFPGLVNKYATKLFEQSFSL